MEITLQQYNNIQDYLDGSMSADQQEAFSFQLEKDSFLREHVAFELVIRRNMKSIEEKRLWPSVNTNKDAPVVNRFDDPLYIQNLIKTAGEGYVKESIDANKNKTISLLNPPLTDDNRKNLQPKKIVRIHFKTVLAIAASVMIAVTSLVWLFSPAPPAAVVIIKEDSSMINKSDPGLVVNRPKDSSNTKYADREVLASLYKEFFSKDKIPADEPRYIASALVDFERGKYTSIQQHDIENIPVYRGSGIDSKQNVLEIAHYYKGLAFNETKAAKQAKSNLQWVVDSAKNQQLALKARWYLALVYLKENNIDKTISLLASVSNNEKEIVYSSRAKRLMEKLKQ